MAAWLAQNALTIAVIAVLILVIAAVVVVLIRDKKKHASPCGGKCAGCPYSGGCANKQGK